MENQLIAERRARCRPRRSPLPNTLDEARGLEFHPVIAEGVFFNDKEIFLGAASERRPSRAIRS